jgi:hypothetical protein
LTGVSIGNVAGGEIRLAGTVLEDNFDDTVVNSSLWLQTDAHPTGPDGSAVQANGVVTLDAIALRSQMSFDQSHRFFEARALVQVNSDPPGWPDLGFYRELPPLYYSDPIVENTAFMLGRATVGMGLYLTSLSKIHLPL